MRTRAQAHDPSALDVAYLATTYGVEEAELHALIDAPTTELVRDFLATITGKGEEFDKLNADKLKVEVELENTVRTSDTKVKAQKAAVTRQTKEIDDLRTKLNEAETAREALASELEKLRSSSTGSSAETQTLRQRLETLEASNRDALALVESKSTEKDRVATELSEQHSKLLALRREISQLEERNQSLENATSSQKFKEQSLQQEIDLLKRNNEWHSNELQTRNQEHAKFRKERNARISTLERELQDSTSNVEGLKRTESTLRQRLDEVQGKADEAFARIATLQEEAARKEQDFRTELSGSKRLSELQAQNAATHKARLAEVQSELEQVREDTHDEVSRLQAEIETERMDKQDAEQKVAELELKVEDLEQQVRTARPSTPVRNGSPTPGTPNALSGSLRKTVNGLSFTQLYTRYTEAQEELAAERRRTDKLSTALDEIVHDMETRKPEFEDLRAEQTRLEGEVLNYSDMLESANKERDQARQEVEVWQAKANAAEVEGDVLRQQLRDLSAQVKVLLVEVSSRDQGLGELSADERLEFERAARGELEEGVLESMTDTGRIIQERFVIFRNVDEMYSKYKEQLQATRNLAERMEGAEALEKARQFEATAAEVEDLRRQVARYKDELEQTDKSVQSFMKERDMFRRMLQHRGQLAPDADLQSMFGQSVGPGTPSRNSMAPPATPRSKETEDLNKLLKEQQTFFDQYRNESSTDRRILKEQVDALARDKSTLQANIARAQSQLTLATERYEMLQSNFNALRSENGEMQKRSQQLAEQAAKQDLRTQQVAEELVEARSMTESLRNENANARAEKELWKRIEARLTDDNRTLMDERSRLNKLVTDLQNLQNERELSESESRRRLQSRVESLENELSETKKKYEAEVEESRKAALRREYDESQNRTRIDDLVKSLGNTREELAAAKTARDSLQVRVDEMKIELRSAEEKVTALQPRPTPRLEPSQNGEQRLNGDEDVPAEQRLALEVADLRRELDLTKTELESAKQQVEEYKKIAQSAEDELASFSETADKYKEDTESHLAERNTKIRELEKRVDELSTELSQSNSELSDLRGKIEDHTRVLEQHRTAHESELKRAQDYADEQRAAYEAVTENVQAQADIAKDAQANYDAELIKHAEATKALTAVRKEYNDLRLEIAGLKAEAEVAKASLERGEESWAEQRERFEQELEEAKRKRRDLDEQNKILHQNLESFSNELAALRQGRAAEGEARESAPTGSGEGNFQEVIKFLRREKEIVDVQYELVSQEAKRLQQQLDYANSQLDESRQKLADERRQTADRANAEGSTNKLMQTINELNTYRESNSVLRNDLAQVRNQLKEKAEQAEQLLAEMEPLKGRVGELEGELENKEGEMKLLLDDRDHWRERTQNIISKYDRVDPAEIEAMKKQIEDLNAEKQRLESEQAPLREKVEGIDALIAEERENAQKDKKQAREGFVAQAKEQDRKRRVEIQELRTQKEDLSTELTQVKADLEALNTELASTKTLLEESQEASAAKAQTGDAEEGQIQEDGSAATGEDHAALHNRIASAEAAASEHASRAEFLNNHVQTLQARVQELEGQVADLHKQLSDAQVTTTGAPTENAAALEQLQQELTNAQHEVQTLRATAQAAPAQTLVNAEPAPGEKSVADQVAEEVAQLRTDMEKQHELAKQEMEKTCQERINKQRESFSKQMLERSNKIKADMQQEHTAEIQRIKEEHNAAIDKLKADHQAELDRLSQQGSAAIDKADSEAVVKIEAMAAESDFSKLELTDKQVKDLVRVHEGIKALVTRSIKSNVEKQTATLNESVESKKAEIAELKQKIEALSPGETGEITESDKVSRAELEQQLELLRKEKDEAVAQAQEQARIDQEAAVKQARQNAEQTAEKKSVLQKRFLATASAKVQIVQQAAEKTPTKPVKEVWDVASKAQGAPPTQAKQDVPPSPSQAKPAGTLGQPQQSSSPAPNPQAAAFTPSSSMTAASAPTASAPAPKAPAAAGAGPAALRANAQSGIPQPGSAASGSKLPRAGGPPSRQASIGGPGGVQIQGAAGAQRGGGATGLPRGGGPFTRGGRGGSRGAATAANAGQKRQHDGASPAGGDNKRTRGGPPSGGAS
ncbi:hypothetical protein CLAFUW4_05350 [Fulvia fulva]|uniref:Nucleoprotein TPR/MLP1 domain-containing protein n=1 Tax=Passalora fulva TaxID=5499 RepID=A0A9Q8LHJ1_PASFU|nr:uncharacterized protein CLAFUR5_05498 [Fulvia fulva]KAK4624586.1 hypothetical protein CLAFUR4_05344 [Fulvia fulva]KAK4625374.1 hypothetical protein CLAFUR0_05352 [Fulvia fulva]UJO17569.1 hypothetical protein CLAFUR5_05498 [Fulvia fulva]WPV15340.1 hypothetical protein CLAFUW4_05350 [Fulvia fulva]WPV30385.1 hypothetical protein CLAFUW7_05348 [Fulvia fulva]